MPSTRIVKEIETFEFKEIIEKYKGKIKVNSHADFRLSQMQRKAYKDETLINLLIKESPVFVGIQQNKNYAVFFSKKTGYLRIIFKVTTDNIEIITFYISDHIPKV